MEKIISVIMPIYNPGIYFKPCIESILNQTFNNFELILIDDCSTDNSYQIAQEYVKKDPRVHLFCNEQNIGAARTRNKGFKISNGKYVIFLDADDFFELNYFESMYNRIEALKNDICICGIINHDEKKNKEYKSELIPKKIKNLINNSFNLYTIPDFIFNTFRVEPFNKLIRRDFLVNNNIEFQDLPNCNDFYFGMIALACANSISFIDCDYAHYRCNWPGNISSKRKNSQLWIKNALEAIKNRLTDDKKFSICKKSFYKMVISQLFYYITLNNNNSTLQTIKSIIQEFNMWDLKYKDLDNYKSYAFYKLIMTNNAILGKKLDIINCLFTLLLHGHITSVSWILYYYLMNLIRKILKVIKK